jgi:hypothetical protein
MVTLKVVNSFFDRDSVISAMDKATRKALSKAGAFIRTRARSSMRRRKSASSPGSPPSVHKGTLKNLLFFSWDPATKSVVIGPEKFARGEAPNLNEFGGTVTRQRTVRVSTRTGARKLSAAQKAAFLSKLKTGEISLPQAKKVVTVKASYPKRSFMGPALKAELPNLPSRWANSVKGS